MNNSNQERGYALVTVLLLLAVVSALLAAYFTLTSIETSTTKATINAMRGFYVAEAGLNIRAKEIRQVFDDYRFPVGAGPTVGGTPPPCSGANQGSGDFACDTHGLLQRQATSFVVEEPGNPAFIVIPRGEPYQNLKAQEYRYTIGSTAVNAEGDTEAMLDMRIKTRLVPLFQFIAFYGKDLEILPGPAMTMSGPIHTNGDLYLDPETQLDVYGQITSAGDIYRGQKHDSTCQSATPLQVIDPGSLRALPSCPGGSRIQYSESDFTPWNGMIHSEVKSVQIPPPQALDPVAGRLYWDRADIRIMLDIHGAPAIEVRNADGSVNGAKTTMLAGCGAAGNSTSFYNNREGADIDMLEIDAEKLLDCLHNTTLLGAGNDIDDTSDGGLVWYLGVDGPDSAGLNSYGVRVYNGSELASTSVTAPDIAGLSMVTNQAMYVQGNFNAINKKPAAFLCDSINVLSNNWSDANDELPLSSRTATQTTINAAFLAGTDSTGGVEGSGGQNLGGYNGGLENYPRFHEKWTGQRLIYRGSFVSLNPPQHASGAWFYGHPQYEAPIRDWDFETDFDNVANLPPLTPRFTYVRLELMRRRFE